MVRSSLIYNASLELLCLDTSCGEKLWGQLLWRQHWPNLIYCTLVLYYDHVYNSALSWSCRIWPQWGMIFRISVTFCHSSTPLVADWSLLQESSHPSSRIKRYVRVLWCPHVNIMCHKCRLNLAHRSVYRFISLRMKCIKLLATLYMNIFMWHVGYFLCNLTAKIFWNFLCSLVILYQL